MLPLTLIIVIIISMIGEANVVEFANELQTALPTIFTIGVTVFFLAFVFSWAPGIFTPKKEG